MKTSEELEAEFIANSLERTGKSINGWMLVLKETGLVKMKETVDCLRSAHGITHMNATFIAGIFLNGSEPVHDPAALFKAHFEGKEDKKPIYDRLEETIKSTYPQVQIVPAKGYISFRNPKEFAVAKINKAHVRIGMDPTGVEFNDYVQKVKSSGYNAQDIAYGRSY